MQKFLLNEGYQTDERLIEAEWYETVGEFIDFFVKDGASHGSKRQVFRVRAQRVLTIELKS